MSAPSSDEIAELLTSTDKSEAVSYKANQSRIRAFPDHTPPLVIKSPRKGLLHPLTRHLIRREYRIYQRLKGVPGIAPCYGLYFREHLVLGYLPGCRLRHQHLRPPYTQRPHPGIARLRQTIAATHARGVAHVDLKRHSNLILGPDEQLYIIDFGTALLRAPGRRGGPLWRWGAQQDWNAWARHGWGSRPEGMPPAVARLQRDTWVERVARRIRRLYRSM